MAVLDFPNPPLTVGQQFVAGSGITYGWDGVTWTIVATPPTAGGPAGGDLVGTYPNPTLAPAVRVWESTAANEGHTKAGVHHAQVGNSGEAGLAEDVYLLVDGQAITGQGPTRVQLQSARAPGNASLLSGDRLGAIQFWGYNATAPGFLRGATIEARASADWGAFALPTDLALQAQIVASGGPTDRLVLRGDGTTVLPDTSGVRVGDATAPRERLDVAGAVIVGAATNAAPVAGTVQWNGTNFQGRTATAWVDFGAGPPTWTDTVTLLQPTKGATYPIEAGSLSVSAANSIQFGSRVAKGHFLANTGTDAVRWTINQYLAPAENAWIQEDTTRPSWDFLVNLIDPAADSFSIARIPVGGGVQVPLLTLVGAGTLNLNAGRSRIGDGAAPREALDVAGAVVLAGATAATAGTVQWNGTNFQGRTATAWVNFGASVGWESTAANETHTVPGVHHVQVGNSA